MSASSPSTDGRAPTDTEFTFGVPVADLYSNPEDYDPGDDLVAAVKVALLLGMPLLLTGEPGCGKTSVAAWLAWRLGLGQPLVFNVKSTSLGRDILYQYDNLARFLDAHSGVRRDPGQYLSLSALGLAILLSTDPQTSIGGDLVHRDLIHGTNADFGARRVVLIDELDKAPRDTPNDLLLEIDRMRFRISELDVEIIGRPQLRPAVVITSNSEKNLPEPFLRRCVYHHLQAPNGGRRREIVSKQKHPFLQHPELFQLSMGFLDSFTDRISRRPGTSELLAWLTALEARFAQALAADSAWKDTNALEAIYKLVRGSLGVLVKTQDDLATANEALNNLVYAR